MNEFSQDLQRKIYDLIAHNPGLHLSKIAELLDLKISEADAHLRFLERKGKIVVSTETNIARYFIDERKVKTRDKRTLEIRRKLYDIIANHPGLYLSQIADRLGISVPLADYHLLYMQKNREITVIKDKQGYFKRYYLTGSGIENREKSLLEILRKKIPLTIVLSILQHSKLRHKELMEQLNLTSSTLSYHLTKLVDANILVAQPHGDEKGFSLKNKQEIIKILRKYELHIELHLVLDDYKDLWDQLSYQDSLEK